MPERMSVASRLASFLLTLLLAGCGYSDSRLVHQAQISMIGTSVNDLEACAGPPDKVTKLNPQAAVYTYNYKMPGGGGFNLSLPLSLGGVSIGGGGGSCRMIVRVVHDHVTELHYTGDDDRSVGDDGICDPLIRGCMRQPEPTMQPVDGVTYDRSSAFGPPPVPAQPPAAEAAAPPPAAPAAHAK